MNNADSQYCELRMLYKRAEDAIHNLGLDGTGVDFSAINELRYAGFHILKAITAKDERDRDEQINRAKRHCERSLYDAYDGSIFFHLTQYQQFKVDYAKVVISDVVPNFIEIERIMKEAKQFLEEARNDTVERSDYYLKIEERYPDILKASETTQAARDELNKARRKSRRFWASPLAILAAAIIGAGTTLLISHCS